MALLPVLSPDFSLPYAVSTLVPDHFSVARATTWDRLLWLVRERPATAVIIDGVAMTHAPPPEERVAQLRRRFPSLGCIFVSQRATDRVTLLRLGRAAVSTLELVPVDDLAGETRRAVSRVTASGTHARVVRAVGSRLPRAERGVLRAALDGALLGWRADELSARAGWTRAHLSVRLRGRGLPSAGHLLLWARLLHAGRWLTDPGRSAESVSRQLGYANGGVFRRALRNYVQATPTEVRERGGLEFVLGRFLDVCSLGDSVRLERSVA
ncbi:MAG: helix-turn-helix domain-containing protein [Gemmatimonadota bacterium]|nr:helix-turn-helix domain-containing protein [Gemmatimonadota bacterium]